MSRFPFAGAVFKPVPPLVTPNVPLIAVLSDTFPQEGATPTPPLIRQFPVATSASRANVVGASA